MASLRLSPPPGLEVELADCYNPGLRHQRDNKVLNHLLFPALRLDVPARQQDILLADLAALTRLAPPQPPCFPVHVEDDDLSRPTELRKVFQDESIFPPEDLLINITPESLCCDTRTYDPFYTK